MEERGLSNWIEEAFKGLHQLLPFDLNVIGDLAVPKKKFEHVLSIDWRN
jgi:hypothetical protein